MLVVDYFSRFVEISNGPQYVSWEMKQYARQYGFNHITSSPHYPQSNGQAERAVQTVKKPLKQAEDPWVALLIYHTAPLPWCNLSPAQLLMGRRLRTTVPVIYRTYPKVALSTVILQKGNLECSRGNRQVVMTIDTENICKAHWRDEEDVWVTTGDEMVKGQIRGQANTPRSYYVDIPSGQVRVTLKTNSKRTRRRRR